MSNLSKILPEGLSDLCSCGCKGWCSVWPMLQAFREDVSREHADLRLPIIDFKADWPALVEICGLRTWSHSVHCCPCCLAKKTDLSTVGNFSLMTCPFPEYDADAYAASLAHNFKDRFYAT